MPLAAKGYWRCTSCAFQVAEWLAPSIKSSRGKRYKSTHRATRSIQLSHSTRFDSQYGNTKPSQRVRLPRPPSVNEYTEQRPSVVNPNKYELFTKLVLEQLKVVRSGYIRGDRWGVLRLSYEGQRKCEAYGIGSFEECERKLAQFRRRILDCIASAYKGETSRESNELFFRLRNAFVNGDVFGLKEQIEFRLLDLIMESRGPGLTAISEVDIENQKQLADLRYPTEWYPATRALQRTIYLHVGPTNSGKTYHALKRLEAADTGIYAGPLRLLAHEVYTRLNAKGKLCSLVTGEEKRIPENMKHFMSSCTVEMVPLNTKVDVAVIDEIQMLGDADRGWAWTQAFLGVQAKEVHLCGELRTIELVKKLCAVMGDKLIINEYERLSPLKMTGKSIGTGLDNLVKGDAIILFSRFAIHGMKKRIEMITGRRCAIIYGSLPPETRAQQANLFNDPDNDYDFLVASDAVGMGLNLSIKRIIFESTAKFNGRAFVQIQVPEIKQIAGRAGRYKTARDAVEAGPNDITDGQPAGARPLPISNAGWITTLQPDDHGIVRKAMETDVQPLESAGIFPPSNIMRRFSSYFPRGTPFSYILLRLHDLASIGDRFHMCNLGESIEVADAIQPYDLSVNDRLIFMQAPVALREPGFPPIIAELASCVANQQNGHLLSLKTINLELLDMDKDTYQTAWGGGGASDYLRDIELLHKAITLYLWLSYRFGGVFNSQALAFHAKALVEEKINECLSTIVWDEDRAIARSKIARAQAKKQVKISELRNRSNLLAGAAFEDAQTNPTSNESLSQAQPPVETDESPATEAGVPNLPDHEEQMVGNRGPLLNNERVDPSLNHLLETHDKRHEEDSKV